MATSRSSIGSHARYTVKWPLPILCRSSSGPQRFYHFADLRSGCGRGNPDSAEHRGKIGDQSQILDESPLLAAAIADAAASRSASVPSATLPRA